MQVLLLKTSDITKVGVSSAWSCRIGNNHSDLYPLLGSSYYREESTEDWISGLLSPHGAKKDTELF